MTPRLQRVSICVVAVILSALLLLRWPSAEVRARWELIRPFSADSSLEIYEGLPHPKWHGEHYKKDLAAKPIRRIEGHEFYKQRILPGEELQNQLREVCAAGSSYRTFSGQKLCGGFHADYALCWSHRKGFVNILVCFGCEEVWMVSETVGVQADLSSDAVKSLAKLLAKLPGERDHPELLHKGIRQP
jgi:hypothetical protein